MLKRLFLLSLTWELVESVLKELSGSADKGTLKASTADLEKLMVWSDCIANEENDGDGTAASMPGPDVLSFEMEGVSNGISWNGPAVLKCVIDGVVDNVANILSWGKPDSPAVSSASWDDDLRDDSAETSAGSWDALFPLPW